MTHLSHTDLKAFIKDFYHYTEGAISEIAQLYTLSVEVLIHLVGKRWVQDNVFGLAPIDTYLRSNSDITEDKFKHSDRGGVSGLLFVVASEPLKVQKLSVGSPDSLFLSSD